MVQSASSPGGSLLHQLVVLAAWKRLTIGLLPATLLALFTPAGWPLLMRLLAAWDGFALCTLLVTWGIILVADVGHIRQVATREDPGRGLSFGVVLLAALASLLGVVLLLSSVRAAPDPLLPAHVAIATVGVLTAWLLVHTLFTLRYAHLYYDSTGGRAEGGLLFPGDEKEPDYLDFAYFAFVIGMTAQTADVSISDRALRRLALLHGLLSFGFNTAVVALVINGLAGLL
ncbi:DUF1345 domain-containing protein [Hymenobacter perfusus]|uniref:DUF1345 domain-containing protein n=1 Tax=Hymenobacter perfusus TaxID=1236770 RepID=A0A428KIS6_9BACT|nr:DUF1345 domain-containing protein [Hymenobacter perfusus]RSK46268.1 DUF1345 domain-containing protein [Hymenobacter perfusus]